jgi:hypothetical protein
VAHAAIANVGPTFEENAGRNIAEIWRDGMLRMCRNNVKTPFETGEIVPTLVILLSHALDSFGALPCAAHQLGPARGRVTNATFHFDADDIELHSVAKERRDFRERFGYGGHLRTAFTPDCDRKFIHERKEVTANSSEFPRTVHGIRICGSGSVSGYRH